MWSEVWHYAAMFGGAVFGTLLAAAAGILVVGLAAWLARRLFGLE